MDPLAGAVSEALGLSKPVSRFLIAYGLSVPVSLGLRALPAGTRTAAFLRHCYAAVSGMVLTYLAFGWDALPIISVPVATAFLAMHLTPKDCGLVTFAGTFTFLIACHVWLMSGDAWRDGGIDCTGALMILTLKATSVAVDCQDGVRRHRRRAHKLLQDAAKEPPSEGAAAARADGAEPAPGGAATTVATSSVSVVDAAPAVGGAAPKAMNGSVPAAERKRPAAERSLPHALERIPSLVEFLGYCFCCGLHFAGPFYFFGDYKDWAEGKKDYGWIADKKQRQPPFARRLLQALGQAALAAVVFLYLDSILDVSVILKPSEYWALPVWRRALLLYLAGTTTRWKYYFIWSVSEAALVASGLGFSGWRQLARPAGGTQEVVSWERAENCHIVGVELATSAALFALNWNVSVGRWLRTYVYERLVPAGKKPQFVHLLVTQLVAGVWHGLYPGYILFFSGIAWEVAASRVLYRWEKSIPASMRPLQILAMVAHGLFAAFCNNFFAIGFIVLSAKDTFTAWAGLYYTGVWIPAVIMTLDMATPKGKKTKTA